MVNYKLPAFRKYFGQNKQFIFYFQNTFKKKVWNSQRQSRMVLSGVGGGEVQMLVKGHVFSVTR